MNSEIVKELIKSKVYGLTIAEMSDIYCLPENEISDILRANAYEIEAEKSYRAMLEAKEG